MEARVSTSTNTILLTYVSPPPLLVASASISFVMDSQSGLNI